MMIGVRKKDHRMHQWHFTMSLWRGLCGVSWPMPSPAKPPLANKAAKRPCLLSSSAHVMITLPGTGEVVGAPGAGLGAGVSLSLALATFSQAMKRRKEVLMGS